MAKNNILINEQHRYQNLQERYEEMNEFLLELLDEHKHVEENLRYLEDFILYKNLEKEFRYFKEHAHEETETNLPFPNLVL